MDAAEAVYSTKPASPPVLKDDWLNNKITRAFLSSSPITQGFFIGATVGYHSGQSWELATAGALAGAVIAIPGATYATTLALIPYTVQYIDRIPSNTPQFQARVEERKKNLQEMCKLADRVKHVTFLALGITATYYLLPDNWVANATAAVSHIPHSIETYIRTPALYPDNLGWEDLGKTILKMGFFASKTLIAVPKYASFCLGFTDFQKFTAASAVVSAAYVGSKQIEKSRTLQPITKPIKDALKKPAAFFNMAASVGTALALQRFGTYLATLPPATNGPFALFHNVYATFASLYESTEIFKGWDTVFPQDSSQPSTTWAERWNHGWNPPEVKDLPFGDRLNTWWKENVMDELIKASSFSLAPETPEQIDTTSITDSNNISLVGNAARHVESSLPSILKQGAIPLLFIALSVHIIYRYYVPVQKSSNPTDTKAATTEDIYRLVNKIKTATNETARKAIDYFPDLRDDILANLKDLLKIEQANRQTDAINNLHGLIVQNINTRINSLKDTLATLVANAKTSPMKIFETGTRLIKAYALKLEELEYRYLTPAHPVGFNDRPRLVRLAEAHALQETKRIYEKQIVLVKELKNELEKMSAPQGNIATVVGYHANLETEKAKISTSLKDKLGDLGADFPRVKDWEKTLDNIFDENQVHLSYFEDTLHPSQRFSMTYQMLAPALTANAEGWLSTLSNAEIAAFRSNPIETLPKLTPAQRNALRALDDASVTSLGLKKVNLSTQLFGGANPNADQLTELQRIMLPA